MRAYERLMRYAAVDTQSDENGTGTPSTPKQFGLCRMLKSEMEELGLERVFTDENAYTYGFLPASAGWEAEPVIGLIAHIDTSPDYSGAGVRPVLHPDYDGRDLPLGDSGIVIRTADFPDLGNKTGKTIMTADGTTLLGADDKAGVAEIMTACEQLKRTGRAHGAVSVCFTPDEEIGHGAALLDLERLGAEFAYTVDGGDIAEINYETFNAASAAFEIRGVSVHPGSAKNIMVNAALAAAQINAMLPEEETPARTEGYEGFYHLTDLQGDVSHAVIRYIVRDHDAARFEARCGKMREIERKMNRKYGEGTVTLTLREQYRNMAEILAGRMDVVNRAEKAIRDAGLTPAAIPVRGGTDGSQLSFRGLPCPNLGTGGAAFHGPSEHIAIEDMDKAVEILMNIVSRKAGDI